jgi:membrane associated rhomboid family serine protease
MSHEASPDDLPRAAVGTYTKFSHAQERGLVAAAMELPYWVIREGPVFVLYVEAERADEVALELEKFESEAAQRVIPEAVGPPLPKIQSGPLFLAAWVLGGCWAAQNIVAEKWVERGAALNTAIFAGEGWRVFTALTLHGDLGHFLANLFFGLVFAAFLQPRLGAGVAWLGIVLAGGLGNLANAAFYQNEPHSTIGASTAVFGALGLLVAWECVSRWRHPGQRGWWQLVVPIGGGAALLAFLGAGDETGQRIDYMAHFWGLVAGVALGLFAAAAPRAGKSLQRCAACAAVILLAVAWGMAVRG